MIKHIALSLLAGLAVGSSATAGQPTVSKDVQVPAPLCFADREFQFDLFGTYTDSRSHGDSGDGFGGGLGMNFFFTRYIGLGIEGTGFDDNGDAVWDANARLIARYPFEGAVCIAPYIFGGGGGQSDGTSFGTGHAGAGLEWRATSNFGVFGEGRYTWVGDAHGGDQVQARLGVRFAF